MARIDPPTNEQIIRWAESRETQGIMEKLREDVVVALEQQPLVTAENRESALELIRRLQSINGMRAVATRARNAEKRQLAREDRSEEEH